MGKESNGGRKILREYNAFDVSAENGGLLGWPRWNRKGVGTTGARKEIDL